MNSLLPRELTPHRQAFQKAWQLGEAPTWQDPLSLLLLDFFEPGKVSAQVLFREKERQRYQRTLQMGHCVFLSYTTAPSPFGARVSPASGQRGLAVEVLQPFNPIPPDAGRSGPAHAFRSAQRALRVPATRKSLCIIEARASQVSND